MNIDGNKQIEAYVDDLLVGLVAGEAIDRSSAHLHSYVGIQLTRRCVHEAVRGGHHKAVVPDGCTAETSILL